MRLLVLLIINSIAGTVYAQFDEPKILAQGQSLSCTDLQFIDLNADGIKDMVGASSVSNTVFWIENQGDNHFGTPQIIASDIDVEKMVLADIDGDGVKDILCACYDEDRIVWYKNLGGGGFGSQMIISSTTNGAISVCTIDMDNDGNLDVVSLSRIDQKIAVYKNMGGGNSWTQQMNNFLPMGTAVYSSDLDNDGLVDIVFSGSSNTYGIYWMKNLGANTFGPYQLILTTYNASLLHKDIAFNDLDNDGDSDIVATSTCAGCNIAELLVLENTGAGSFVSHVISNGSANLTNSDRSIFIGDIDGDGIKDILSNDANAIIWFKNLGGLSFGASQLIAPIITSTFPVALQREDINGDAQLDVFVGNGYNLELISNLNGTSFGSSIHIQQNVTSIDKVITADINNDGNQDIVSSGTNGVSWWENVNNDTLIKHSIALNVGSADMTNVADYDNDGDLDVLVLGSLGNTQVPMIFENQGTDYWNLHTITFNGLNPYYFFSTDVDGDGRVDVVVSSNLSWETTLLINNGSYNFSEQTITMPDAVQVFAFDDDQDGDKDLFAGATTSHKVMRLEQIAPWQFASPDTLVNQQFYTPSTRISGEDIDGDGDADLLVSQQNGSSTYWKENLGSGNYAGTLNQIGASYDAILKDLDDDGDLDAVLQTIAAISWRENLGNGVLASPISLMSISDLNDFRGIAVDDFDQDTDFDLMWVLRLTGKIFIRKNLLYSSSQVSGRLFVDANQNGLFENSEQGIGMAAVFSEPESDFSYTYTDGRYILFVSDSVGAYTIAPEVLLHWGISSDSLVYNITVDSNFQSVDSLDFGFYPIDTVDLLSPQLVGGFPRCNTVVNYWLDLNNIGTTIPSGVVHLKLDDNLSYLGAGIVPDSINGQHLYWNYDSLDYFTHLQWNIQVQMPTFQNMGDTLSSFLTAIVNNQAGDSIAAFTDTLSQILVCAYDPNDKVVEPVGFDLPGYLPTTTDWLEYTIRFQNTGNDTALRVVIQDQLDPSLNWHSLQPLAYSHPVVITVDQNGLAKYTFDDIYLPDSTTNELASHGFIRYRIKIDSTASAGTLIQNTANIYFDYNPAVITNTTTNTLFDCPISAEVANVPETICEQTTLSLQVDQPDQPITAHWEFNGQQYNGADFSWVSDTIGVFQLHHSLIAPGCITADTTFTVEVVEVQSASIQPFTNDTICLQSGSIPLPIGLPSGGVYQGNGVSGNNFDPLIAGVGQHFIAYSLIDNNNCNSIDSSLIQVEDCLVLNELTDNKVFVSPNPFDASLLITVEFPTNDHYTILMRDATGSIVLERSTLLGKSQEISLPYLQSGVYFLEVQQEQGVSIQRIRLIHL